MRRQSRGAPRGATGTRCLPRQPGGLDLDVRLRAPPALPAADGRGGSAGKLEALEAVQGLLDLPLAPPACAVGEPGPLLQHELCLLAIDLEIDGGDDFLVDEHGAREVAEHPLGLGYVGLEAVFVAEDEG